MKLQGNLAGCLIALCLAGCTHVALDGKSVIELADPAMQPPAALTAACQTQIAALFPDRAMSAGEAERATETVIAWLLDCAARHQAETTFYMKRDALLAGK